MNTLFGLALAPLFLAIAQVESDNGETSDNVYQIRKVYVDDVNRILKLDGDDRYSYDDMEDRARSEEMMVAYWTFYGKLYQKATGEDPGYEVLARIHNGGPAGWCRESTDPYWEKVKPLLGTVDSEAKLRRD